MQLSSLTKKYIVAITGFGLFLFLIGHMVGNLLIFQGRDAINTYGEKLKATGPLLWVVRLGLLALLLVHLYFTITLAIENRAARRNRYAGGFAPKESTFASRWMVLSGLVVLTFIVYHLAHFTHYWTNPEYGSFEERVKPDHTRHDVFRMVTTAFNKPLVVAVYLAAMAVLLLHLSHGVASMFQTVGLSSRRWNWLRKRAALVVAALLVVGFILVPLGVFSGFVESDPKETPRQEKSLKTSVDDGQRWNNTSPGRRGRSPLAAGGGATRRRRRSGNGRSPHPSLPRRPGEGV